MKKYFMSPTFTLWKASPDPTFKLWLKVLGSNFQTLREDPGSQGPTSHGPGLTSTPCQSVL